ncbi:MAG: DNA methyltransferase [Planctomycetaceae bacterium]|nr:DNA methyltransferase [Planctomycetaceae bacterium]
MAKAKRSQKQKAAKPKSTKPKATKPKKKKPTKKRSAKIKAVAQKPVEESHAGRRPGPKKTRKSAKRKSVKTKPQDTVDTRVSKAADDNINAKPEVRPKRKAVPHCNELNGKQWIQNSISVWSDIRKTTEENRLKHPAMFPGMLVERLVETFLRPEGETILDPFSGSGSTIVEVERLGKTGIGIELSPEFTKMGRRRLADLSSDLFTKSRKPRSTIHEASVADIRELIEPESIDLCITSPPYWDILNQRRTADYKDVRHYGNLDGDLGTIADYEQFLRSLQSVFSDVLTVLKPGAYCCVVLMDLRKKNRFFPLHSDFAQRMTEIGFIFDDLIIWNRQSEYNNLRPLGYPAVFRVNKVHEFVVLLQKPGEGKTGTRN